METSQNQDPELNPDIQSQHDVVPTGIPDHPPVMGDVVVGDPIVENPLASGPIEEEPTTNGRITKQAFKYLLNYIGLTFAGIVAILLPAAILYGICYLCIPGAEHWSKSEWALSWLFIGSQLFPLYVFWKKKWCDFSWKRTPSMVKLLLWIVVAWLGYMFVEEFLSYLFDMMGIDTNSQDDLFDGALLPLMIISVCILAPLGEEAVFRGAFERKLLETDRSSWIAIVVSALAFGLMHMDPFVSCLTFLMGILMGWIYYRTRNIWLTVFCHALNNTMATVLDFLIDDVEIIPDTYIESEYPFVYYLISFAVGLALLYLGVRKIAKTIDRDEELMHSSEREAESDATIY